MWTKRTKLVLAVKKTVRRARSQENEGWANLSIPVCSVTCPHFNKPRATGLEPPELFHLTNQHGRQTVSIFVLFCNPVKYEPLTFERGPREVLRHLFSCPPKSSRGHPREISVWANHIDLHVFSCNQAISGSTSVVQTPHPPHTHTVLSITSTPIVCVVLTLPRHQLGAFNVCILEWIFER